ncbi:MAG: anti-sigma factor family protein [Polyangiales bacterium]
MTPDEARDQFSAAYEGELSPEQREAFDEALERDADLRAEYESFRSTMGGMRRLGASDEEPSVDVLGGVQRKLRTRSRGRFYRDRFAQKSGVGRWMPLILGIAMLLVIAVAWMALHFVQVQGTPEPDPDPQGAQTAPP